MIRYYVNDQYEYLSHGNTFAKINQLELMDVCWSNNYNVTSIEMPFDGFKQPSTDREILYEVIDHHTQLKTVYVKMGDI